MDDQPQIHDYELDDPNVQIYGIISNNGERRLTVTVKKNDDEDRDEDFKATVVYECLKDSPPARGGYAFITHPSYTSDDEDAYELFDRLDEHGCAEAVFYPAESFTVAAVSLVGGDTALTFDLKKVKKKPTSSS